MRIGNRQFKILILLYDKPATRSDIYNLVFNRPVKDTSFSSMVAKSLKRLKKNELVNYTRNSIVSITEKGRKKVKDIIIEKGE